MASVKIILWKSYTKKDGTQALAIRITQNRKPKYVFTGKYVLPKHWNSIDGLVKISHPNSKRLNNYLRNKLTEVENIALEAELTKKNNTSKSLQKKVKGKEGKISFFQFGARRIKSKFESGIFSVAKPELSILYNIKEFLDYDNTRDVQKTISEIRERRKLRIGKSRKPGYDFLNELHLNFSRDTSLYFEEIDESFLKKFKIFCDVYLNQKTRTVTNQLIFIRTLFNLAINDFIVESKHYPFSGEKEVIKVKRSYKIGLTKDEVVKIENISLEVGTSKWHTRNVWLFSYYFAGIRISDVLEMKWSNLVDGRLYYTMKKNEKGDSLKIPKQAFEILELYQKERKVNNGYIFPFLKNADTNNPQDIFVKTRNASTLLNKYLKRIAAECGIEKNLSNHLARHTFGNIAGDSISPQMLQKLYRHSDLKTTINYQANFIHKDADEALNAVLNS